MKPLENLTKSELKKIKLIVFDVDGILVRRGTRIKQSNDILKLKIKTVPEKLVREITKLYKKGFMININSGRGLYMLQYMFREIMPYVSITYENGSATWFKGKIYQHVNSFNTLRKAREELEKVKDSEIKGFEPKEFIITIHCKHRVEKIERIVSRYKDLYFIWNSEAYDIGIKSLQTKSRGLKKFCEELRVKKENVLAIGDNYNDKDLLSYAALKISADKSRLKGDFYISLNGKELPGETLAETILKLAK